MPNKDSSNHQNGSGSGPGSQATSDKAAPSYESLHRTWPTETHPHGQTERQQIRLTGSSPAMQRWAAETLREQPWNSVGSFQSWQPVATGQVGRNKGSSAGAEAGSEYRH